MSNNQSMKRTRQDASRESKVSSKPPRSKRGKQSRIGKLVDGYVPSIRGVSGSPFKVSRAWAMAGQEDVECVRMRYETTSAFTATGGAASYLQIKGNSIYRPYPGNTDSPSGYQRLYSQYARSTVLASRVTVNLWSDTSVSVQQPFRLAVVPCTNVQYAVYSTFSNIAALRGVPHSTEALFSPGAAIPSVRGSGSTAQLLLGMAKETAAEMVPNSTYSGNSAVDPTALWYFLVGLQAMAGTTTLNCQLQVLIEFDVIFSQPVGTAVQVAVNKWGNEEVPELKGMSDEKMKTVSELTTAALGRKERSIGESTTQHSAAASLADDDYELVPVRRPVLRSLPTAGLYRTP